MYHFMVIILLLFDLHSNSGHSIKNGTLTLKNNTNAEIYAVISKPNNAIEFVVPKTEEPKNNTNAEIYAVISKPNNVIEFVVPKTEEPTIREILFYRVVEKPYNRFENSTTEPPIEPSTKPPTELPGTSNVDSKPRPLTNGHGYQFRPWSGSEEVAEEYADAEEDLQQEVEKAKKSRLDYFNAAKEKYRSRSAQFTGNSGQRQKRDILKSIPSAPTLPPFNVDQVPELIRRMLSKEKMVTDPPTTERAWQLNNINNRADAVINNTMSFFSPPTALNLKSDYVPKTYGMSLKGNEGFTWNNLAEPRRPQDIYYSATMHNDEKPKESIVKDPLEVLKAILHNKTDTAEVKATEHIKIAKADKNWNHEFQNVEDSKKQQENDKPDVSKIVNKDEKPAPEQDIETEIPLTQDLKVVAEQFVTEKPSNIKDSSSYINSDEIKIDVRSQMQEMFSRFIPPAPTVEDAKFKSGTYGMVLSNGQGEIWNNIAKPQSIPFNKEVIFTKPKPQTDNQTKNIEPTDAQIKREDLKIFQRIFDEEEKIRIENKSQENSKNNLDMDDTSIIFFDDIDDNEVKVINPRSSTGFTINKKEYSVDDIPPPPKLPETKVLNEISLNKFSYKSKPVQNMVQNEKDGEIEEDSIQEKMEKSFKNLMNQVSGFKGIEIESENNKNLDRNIKLPSRQSNNNHVNLNKLSRGLDGTYGMELKGDFGYVWNKQSPNYYDYNIGQQRIGGEVVAYKIEDDIHTESPILTNSVDTTTEPCITTEQSNKVTTGTSVAISTSTTTITTSTTVTSSTKPVLENNTTEIPVEQDKDCNSTDLTSDSNVSTTAISVDKYNIGNGMTTNPSSSATTAAITTSTDTTTIATMIPTEENPNDLDAGKEGSEVTTAAPCTNETTMNPNEANTTKPSTDYETNSTPSMINVTTERTTIPSSVELTTTETAITTEAINTTITPIEVTSTPTMPTNDTSRPLNLNDLLQSEEFWQWLSNWTIPFMEVMNETVKELVKEEVDKQLANKDFINNKTETMTEKPVQNNEESHKNITDTKDNGQNTSIKVEAQTIYGNSLNDDHVTNIFVFYPNNNNTIDDINKLINSASENNSYITNDLNLNTTNKPIEDGNGKHNTTTSIPDTPVSSNFTDKEEKLEGDSANNAESTTVGTTTEKNLETVSAISALSSIVTQAPNTVSISTTTTTETMIGSTTEIETTGCQDPIEFVNYTDSPTTVDFDKITTESSTFANEGLTTLQTKFEETTPNKTEATEYTTIDTPQKTTPVITSESINDSTTIELEIDKITENFQSNDGITEITEAPKLNIISNIVDNSNTQPLTDIVESISETTSSTTEITPEDEVIKGNLETTTDYLTTRLTTMSSTVNNIEIITDILHETTSNIFETTNNEEGEEIDKDLLYKPPEQATSETPIKNLLDSTEKDTVLNNESTTVESITMAESESKEKLLGNINSDQTADTFYEITTESTTIEVNNEKNLMGDLTINDDVSTLSTAEIIVENTSSSTTELSTVNDKEIITDQLSMQTATEYPEYSTIKGSEDELTTKAKDEPVGINSITANYESPLEDIENSNSTSSVIIDSTATESTEGGPVTEKVEEQVEENVTVNEEVSALPSEEITTVLNYISESSSATEHTILETTAIDIIKDTEDVTDNTNLPSTTAGNMRDEVIESTFENNTEINSDNITTTPNNEAITDPTNDEENSDDDSNLK